MTIRQRVDNALTELRNGLNPFVAAQMQAAYRNSWIARAKESLRDGTFKSDRNGNPTFDVTALCSILLDHWQPVFGRVLGKTEYQLIHRVRTLRNEFAHQREITADSAIGDFEAMSALLNAVGAGAEATNVDHLKEETGRERYGAQQPLRLLESETEKSLAQSDRTLIPWRDVIVPHDDVRTRRFLNAEFAANLYDVWKRTESGQKLRGDEYGDPREFFARTFLTSGLERLLRNATHRLSGRGGEPVVELQTSFGGGKTHALLALYHLASGLPFKELQGVRDLLATEGISELPGIRRAVLVGTQMQAGQPLQKPAGIQIRTMWGELGYQLGGADGYAILAGSDQTSTSPGAALGELLAQYAPCIILIDEWVAYARQLSDETALSGGTFETQFTFAQTLTEAVKATKGVMLVLTLPVSDVREEGSDIEVGGARGREALKRLRNVVARTQANWQPADPAESYAIVRRRLFEPVKEAEQKLLDRAVGAIFKCYREKEASFPKHASDPAYRQRLADCYPVHPELFERLYNEWGSLEQFQRTRGVLRLMAAAINTLWAGGDSRPLIMPGTLPLEDPAVKSDLTRYLGNQNQWDSVLSRDVIGADSVAARIDEKDKRLGKHNAAQRSAKSIFLATAPQHADSSVGRGGIDIRAIRLGCAFPSEQISAFDDAVRRLSEEGTHVNSDGARYWFGLAPNLNQRVASFAAQYEQEPHLVDSEIVERLREWQRDKGAFVRIHPAPATSADVSDEPYSRLVILGPDAPHKRNREGSAARMRASEFVSKCGESDRRYKNCLLFLAADESRLDELKASVRQWLAWRKITEDKILSSELTGAQLQEAAQRRAQVDEEVKRRLTSTWTHGLVPTQIAEVGAPIELEEVRVEAGDSVAATFSRKLEAEGKLVTKLGGVYLRHELDQKDLWREQGFVWIHDLYENFARYPYLMRLKDEAVLSESIQTGVSSLAWETETFAYAESYNEETERFGGIVGGNSAVAAYIDMTRGLLVRPDVAAPQLSARETATGGATGFLSVADGEAGTGPSPLLYPERSLERPHRFYQRVTVHDPTMLSRVVNKLGNDIVALLAAKGARTEVSIEINAETNDPIDEALEERLRTNSSAHEFPAPEFD